MARKGKIKKNRHITGLLFWVCLILLAAPFVVLGWILLSSQMDNNTPVLGSRYEGDLDPAITKSQLQEVTTAIANIDDIESSDVQLATATLRVYINARDNADEETVKAKASKAYEVVSGILDPNVYFTQQDGKKMYDLEIHVSNLLERGDNPNFIYVIETKTSSMKEPKAQVVSKPRNAELAQQLRDDIVKREQEAVGQKEAAEQGGIYVGEPDPPAEETSEETQGD